VAALEQKKEGAPDLYRSAHEVAFGAIAAEIAAQAEAAGRVADIHDKLSERDRRMLSIGTLAGAAAAIARSRFPFETEDEALERVDLAVEYARSVEAKDGVGNLLFVNEEEE
jgi:hypothetical protein